MLNIQHSKFFIQSPLFATKRSTRRRRMGSGGLRGLQNRCFGAEASKGWFDSDTPPPRTERPLSSGNANTDPSLRHLEPAVDSRPGRAVAFIACAEICEP